MVHHFWLGLFNWLIRLEIFPRIHLDIEARVGHQHCQYFLMKGHRQSHRIESLMASADRNQLT